MTESRWYFSLCVCLVLFYIIFFCFTYFTIQNWILLFMAEWNSIACIYQISHASSMDDWHVVWFCNWMLQQTCWSSKFWYNNFKCFEYIVSSRIAGSEGSSVSRVFSTPNAYNKFVLSPAVHTYFPLLTSSPEFLSLCWLIHLFVFALVFNSSFLGADSGTPNGCLF